MYSKHSCNYSLSNSLKGTKLENSTRDAFEQLGYNVERHHITDGGVDVNAFKDKEHIVGECLNWYGGFIHPLRWLSIMDNLLCDSSTTKYLLCVGVHPTCDQCNDLLHLNIILVYGVTIADCTSALRDQIRGVIIKEPESDEMSAYTPYSISNESYDISQPYASSSYAVFSS